MNKALSLFELNNLVRQAIDVTLNGEYWVEAELSEARENNGHLYMELVEKDELGNTPLAKASAKCWRSVWTRLRPEFERQTNMRLRAGMKVMLKVYPQFHETYGFSWIVSDIDPTYTLGDMARRRLEIIRILKEEGVFELNKQLPLPMFSQRIAVISSETAAGYGDFCNQLRGNSYGFSFSVKLFNAVMQGEGVEHSVIEALNKIYEDVDSYDCVVIIRGGGASSDLTGFDSLSLAENIANFPLPIITGIGHDRDETVADMVAHSKVKTPTAAAALLIDNLCVVMNRIDNARQSIYNKVGMLMQSERQRMLRLSQLIPTLFSVMSTREHGRLEQLFQRMSAASLRSVAESRNRINLLESKLLMNTEKRMQTERHRLELLAQRLSALDPQVLLKRGYSITTLNGKAVMDGSVLKTGDEIETRFAKGTITSIVE